MVNHFILIMSIEAPSKLKKAYCIHCKTDDELSSIFSVNPEAKVCYCPNCMVELKPKEAIDEYNYFIATKLNKADQLLYRDTRFYDAYCAFGHIIEIDPYIMKARFGRILALLYMSTLRKTHFLDAVTLLDREADQFFHKMKEQGHYAKFLSKALNAVDEYQNRFVKRISYKERFCSEDCVELYFHRLYEIIEVKKFIVNELDKIILRLPDEKLMRLFTNRQNELLELQAMMKDPVATLDGTRYQLANVFSANQMLINRLDESIQPLAHYKIYKLNENEKKGKLIKDKVYPDNSHLMALATSCLPVMLLFFIMAGIATLFFVFQWFNLGIIPLLVAIGCALIGVITLIFLINWKYKLSKRRHLID